MKLKQPLILLSVLISTLALSACGADRTPPQGSVLPQKLTIDFATNPSEIRAGTKAQLIARVSRANQPVKDAVVEMEMWREGETKHETIKATPDGKGAYTVNKTFAEAGTYHVTLHTTTSEIHQMPTVDFQVKP